MQCFPHSPSSSSSDDEEDSTYAAWVEQGRREDWEIHQTAAKVLYGGCPLCVDDDDMCRLCKNWKLECSKHKESRWATRNMKDHAPLSPIDHISLDRRRFMQATGHGNVFNEDLTELKKPKAPSKKAKPKKPMPVAKGIVRKSKITTTNKSSSVGKKVIGTGKKEAKFTSSGYPRESSEWEPLERKLIYRPPGYGPGKYTVESMATPHCTSCHLKPCIGIKMDAELKDLCIKYMGDDGRTKAFTKKVLEKVMMREQRRLFMKRFLLKDPVLQCIQDKASQSVLVYCPEVLGLELMEQLRYHSDEEESEEEDGCVRKPPSIVKAVRVGEQKNDIPHSAGCKSNLLDSSDDESETELFKPVFKSVARCSYSRDKATKPSRVSLSPPVASRNNQHNNEVEYDSESSSSTGEFEFTMPGV